MRLHIFRRKFRVKLDARLVESNLDNGKIGTCLLEKSGNRKTPHFALRLRQVVEAPPEVNRDKVSLMTQLRKDRAFAVLP